MDYERQQTEPQAWLAAIGGIGPKLWTLFAGKLDAALKEAGVKNGTRLIVLPTGALGLLPLELARDPATGRSFADAYNVTAIPSLEAYLAAARAAAKAWQAFAGRGRQSNRRRSRSEPAVRRGRGRDCGFPLQGQAAGQAGPV